MLSLANVSAAHGANYFKVENYYSEKDSVGFSRWTGKDAVKFGLIGAVDHNQFSHLLKGTDSNIQVAGNAQNRKRAGLDMTFSAPKSVSIQALVFGDNRLVEAHREAVSEALAYAEKHYAAYRAGGRNDRQVMKPCKGNGLLVAQFEHDSSRLKDPQLHTHNVVLNRIENENGEVRALHGDLMFKNSVLLGMIYQNSLAKKAQELGYTIKPNAKGSFEIEGFSKDQLAVFSKRKEQIEAMNPESYRETRDLVLKNRQAKEGPQQREYLVERWENEAADHGIMPVKSAERNVGIGKRVGQSEPIEALNRAISSVTTKSSVFKKEEIIKETIHLSLGQFTIEELEKSFDKIKGTKLLSTRNKEMFTTKEAVARDLRIRKSIDECIGTAAPMTNHQAVASRVARLQILDLAAAHEALSKSSEIAISIGLGKDKINTILEPFEAAMKSGKRLSLAEITGIRNEFAEVIQANGKKTKSFERKKLLNEVMNPIQKAFLAPTSGQIEAIEKTLLSKDKYIIWQGVAGAGKTYAVRQIVEEAKQNGFEVKGFAPSAAAALLLSKETGIETDTLQGHILKRENKTGAKCLWIVDEAGMISANDFHAMQTKAEWHNARVLVVGDHRQLSPVDAGNPFLDIQRRTSTTLIHLNESMRQKDALLQVAVAHINRGDVSEGVRTLVASVHEVKTGKGRKNLVAREFTKKNPEGQENTLVLARTNRIREDLTTEIRNGLKKQGFLKNEILVPVLRRIDATDEQLSVSSTYSQADFLVPNRNYRNLGLAKDKPYEIVTSNGSKNTVSVQSGAKTIEIPLSKHHQFSLFSKGTLHLAESDKMIWNRNLKGQDQLNNSGFVVEQITAKGVSIRTDVGQTKIIDPKVPQHMEHAWALTIYKAQGQTASNVLQIVDPGSTKRDLLVGVTRAAHEVMLVAQSKEALFKSAEFGPHKPIAAEEVSETVQNRVFTSVSRGR